MRTPEKIQIGSFTVAFLTDGLWRNDGGCMLGVVPRELWQRDHPPDARNRIRLNLTCPLIMKGRDAVLIDTGIGNRLTPVERKIFDHGDGWLLDGLRALGMEPGDVTPCDPVASPLRPLRRYRPAARIGRVRAVVSASANLRSTRRIGDRAEIRNERLRAAYRHVAECLEPVAAMIEAIER